MKPLARGRGAWGDLAVTVITFNSKMGTIAQNLARFCECWSEVARRMPARRAAASKICRGMRFVSQP